MISKPLNLMADEFQQPFSTFSRARWMRLPLELGSLSGGGSGMLSGEIEPNECFGTWLGTVTRIWSPAMASWFFPSEMRFCNRGKSSCMSGYPHWNACTSFVPKQRDPIDMRRLCLWLIQAYRLMISPLFGPTCRFDPSCSQYASDAITKYGALQGIGLAMLRLLKCHPFHPGGEDPVK